MESREERTRLVRGMSLLERMDHPVIAKLFEVISTSFYSFLVMQQAENGSIQDHVNDNGKIAEPRARKYFLQILSAIEYLHEEQHIFHRDLKAVSVLLDRHPNVRIVDFGLSNSFTEASPRLSTPCGSPAYAPPEMLKGEQYTKAADIWSAGVLLYAMVVGQMPFCGDHVPSILWIVAFTECTYPSLLSPMLSDLLRRLLVKDPKHRLTIEQIKRHPWLTQGRYSQLFNGMGRGVDENIVRQVQALTLNACLLLSRTVIIATRMPCTGCCSAILLHTRFIRSWKP